MVCRAYVVTSYFVKSRRALTFTMTGAVPRGQYRAPNNINSAPTAPRSGALHQVLCVASAAIRLAGCDRGRATDQVRARLAIGIRGTGLMYHRAHV